MTYVFLFIINLQNFYLIKELMYIVILDYLWLFVIVLIQDSIEIKAVN